MALKKNDAWVCLTVWAILIGGLSMLLTQTATAKDISIPNIAPPPLVQCESEASCDRDPKHLEAFVAEFYKWYIANATKSSSIPANLSPEFAQLRKNVNEVRKVYLKKFLTPDFSRFVQKIDSTIDIEFVENNPNSCTSDSGVDPIICAQDWHDEWMRDTSAKLVKLDGNSAGIIAQFPISDRSGKLQKPYLLSLVLKAVDGAWRIDAITYLSKPFHAAATEAEKAVANILKLNSSMKESTLIYDYLTGYRTSANDVYYASLFTNALRDSIITENRRALHKNCGGKYIEGEMCGLEVNPVNCTTDVNDVYFFRTEQETGSNAVVSYAWPGDRDAAATYKLRKISNRWMLDAVSCPGNVEFNWNSRTPDIDPPPLVQCKSEANCDRDPRHLEAFVAGFYEWYAANLREGRSLPWDHDPTAEQRKRARDYMRKTQYVMETRLTPHFYAWYNKVKDQYDGQNSAGFCANPDADPFLCQLDSPDQWIGDVSARVSIMSSDTCQLAVHFPEWVTYDGKHHLPYQLLVKLKLVKGAWRLDLVREDSDSDK